MSKGKVYLIGAGPGKPDLITVRGLRILKSADVILYDYLVDERILEYAKDDAELICCGSLAGKGKFSKKGSIDQEKINRLLIEKVKTAKVLVRLKNGDPSFFSRISEELAALVESGIQFEIVPGVTAASAAACFGGIPLTDRMFSSSCVFVTGTESVEKSESSICWDALAKIETIVFYMAVGKLRQIITNLVKAGKAKNTPVAVIQNATLPSQKILTGKLSDISQKAKLHRLRPPAIVIVGRVVRRRDEFNWIEENKRILFTGLSRERFFLKENYEHFPLLTIRPAKDYRRFDQNVKKISSFDWIVFTSRYGVKYFLWRLGLLRVDIRNLVDIKIAAIGASTAHVLIKRGIYPDIVPQEESSKGLIKELSQQDLKGKNIFLPRSNLSDKGLTDVLSKLGACTVAVIAYRNVMPRNLPDLDLNQFDTIMFTSPSTVRNFQKRYKEIPKRTNVSCIGDVTLKEAKRCMLLD